MINIRKTAKMFTIVCAAAISQLHGQTLDEILKRGIDSPAAGPQRIPGGSLTAGAAQPGAKFNMDLPPGWHGIVTPAGAVVARSADGAASVLIAPVTHTGNAPAADWLKMRGSAALNEFLKNAAVSAIYPSRTSPAAALASVDFAGQNGPGAARALYFVAGEVGTLYAIAAPRQALAQQAPLLLRILQSFSFAGERQSGDGAAQQPEMNIRMTKFTDPREAAFTVDAPAGWKLQGGTIHLSTLEFRMSLYCVSPDGSAMIRLGDPDFGTMTEPTRLLAMAGLREGMNYSPGYGNVWPIRRYMPGPQFGQMYAQKLAREVQATNLQFKNVRPLPEFNVNTAGGAVIITAGEASFACTRNGRDYAGTVYAATQRLGMPGQPEGAIWFASALADFIAPAEDAASINRVVLEMLKSFQLNPQWLARQSNMAMETSRIATEANDHISKVINDSYWTRTRRIDETHRRFDDYIRGVVRLRDRDTGEEIEGRAGKNYYYKFRGDERHPIGTDREIRNPDFRELEQIR